MPIGVGLGCGVDCDDCLFFSRYCFSTVLKIQILTTADGLLNLLVHSCKKCSEDDFVEEEKKDKDDVKNADHDKLYNNILW